VYAASLDFDKSDISFKQLELRLQKLKLECVIHTTYSHSSEKGKFRVFVLLDKPIETNHGAVLTNIYDYFQHKLRAEIDTACKTPAQMFYPPSCPPDAEKYYRVKHLIGKTLCVKKFSEVDPDEQCLDDCLVFTPSGHRPGDDYNSKGSWDKLLLPLGWKLHYRADNKEFWTRPGKSGGISAVVFTERKLFYVHSTAPAVKPFEPRKAYSLFAAYTTVHHNGDYREAAAQLKAEGYGSTDSSQSKEALERAKTAFPLVNFPLDIFPRYFQILVNKYSKALQCQSAFMAMIFLVIISGAAGNAVALRIKRKWRVAPFLWFYVVGISGEGKSHPINVGMEPLLNLQDAENSRYQSEESEYRQNLEKYKQTKEGDVPEVPQPMRHYYTSNFTIEALISMFKDNSRGILIHVDELAGLFSSMNQYKGGKGSDNEQFLSLFDCKPLKTDRKGKTEFCKESGAAVIGGIQNNLLTEVFNDKMHTNGMVYRFLPMMLNDITPTFTEDDISQSIEDKWLHLINWMYEICGKNDFETGQSEKIIFTVSKVGKKSWKEFHDELSRQRKFMPKSFGGYLSKLKTYCLKIMSILHLLNCYQDRKLSMEVKNSTVKNAITLTNYFAGQVTQLITKVSKEPDPYISVFKEALSSLNGDVQNGKLFLSDIRDKVNKLLPAEMALDKSDKRIGKWLREIGFDVKTSTGNKAVVIWNPDIVI
jgi:hypothetical protein